MERTKKKIDMDYEKKYNEALGWMRQLYPCLYGQFREDAERFFPELKESEDERMIKAIEHILYENYSDAAVIEGVEIAEIVTWLEKQKEQSQVADASKMEHEVDLEKEFSQEYATYHLPDFIRRR